MQTPPDISHPLIIYLSSTVYLIISARNLVRGDYPMSTVSVSFEIGHRHWIYNTVIIDQSRFNWFKGEARKKFDFGLIDALAMRASALRMRVSPRVLR